MPVAIRPNQSLLKSVMLLMLVVALGLSGCVTRLGGSRALPDDGVEELGAKLQDATEQLEIFVWADPKSASTMGQIAGILLSGARSAGQTLDIFGDSDKEDPSKIAHLYRERKARSLSEAVEEMTAAEFIDDVEGKITETKAATQTAEQLLKKYQSLLSTEGALESKSVRSSVVKSANRHSRVLARASKSLDFQFGVFSALEPLVQDSSTANDVDKLQKAVERLAKTAEHLKEISSGFSDLR